MEVRKFIIASTEHDALNTLSVWTKHQEIRNSLSDHVFDAWEDAEQALRNLVQRAEKDSPFGCTVPCADHSRCVGFDPHIWDVRVKIS